MYISYDGGYSWMDIVYSGPLDYRSVTISADGKSGAALSSNGCTYLYRFPLVPAPGVCINGNDIISLISYYRLSERVQTLTGGGFVVNSFDNGAHWTYSTLSKNITFTAAAQSSNDFSRMVAVSSNGSIFISTDTGASWAPQPGAPVKNWTSVAMSADGLTILAGAAYGGLYTSTDGGVTWSKATSPGDFAWSAVDVSDTAATQIASVKVRGREDPTSHVKPAGSPHHGNVLIDTPCRKRHRATWMSIMSHS